MHGHPSTHFTAVKPYVEPDTACSQFAQRNGPSKLNAITVCRVRCCCSCVQGQSEAAGVRVTVRFQKIIRLYLILE